MMYTAQLPDKGPFSIRYPRGNGTMVKWRTPFKELPIGQGRCIIEGEDVAIVSIGAIGNEALKAIEKGTGRSVAFYDMRFLKPLDEKLLHSIFHKFKKIITLEDGTIVGGVPCLNLCLITGIPPRLCAWVFRISSWNTVHNNSYTVNVVMIANLYSGQFVRYKRKA